MEAVDALAALLAVPVDGQETAFIADLKRY
jgi:hypothetical protein